MQVVHSSAALQEALKGKSKIAFVPTMGNLHAGHIELVNIAKQHADCVVVSIFVNPLQFDSAIDLEKYPRTLEADCEQLEKAGATIVFAPTVKEMYSDFDGKSLHQTMTITPPPIADTKWPNNEFAISALNTTGTFIVPNFWLFSLANVSDAASSPTAAASVKPA